MKRNRLVVASALSVLGLSSFSLGAVLPTRLPSFELPSGLIVSAPLPAPMLPSFPAPVPGPMSLPGAAVPLPLALPSVLVPAASLPANEFHLDWRHLDGDEGAAALVAADRGPKPLPPAGAAAQLTFAAKAAKPSRRLHVGADVLFDHARPRVLVALP
ncbi:MAG: hypothetical protein KGJ84_11720 [Elusimicrobia bacterium]|nr:hypothetical protein [Elusimicrobiota bacterium]